ncbi:iron-containing alcohol dehydrogenase [Sinomonas atrocyanea]
MPESVCQLSGWPTQTPGGWRGCVVCRGWHGEFRGGRPGHSQDCGGEGALGRLRPLLEDLGARRAVVATSRSMAGSPVFAAVARGLGDGLAGTFCGMRAHAPMEDVLALADLCRTAEAGAVVSLGGASVIDGTKALASVAGGLGLRHVAVPALFGGAEVTPFAGVTEQGRKVRLAGGPSGPMRSCWIRRCPTPCPTGSSHRRS